MTLQVEFRSDHINLLQKLLLVLGLRLTQQFGIYLLRHQFVQAVQHGEICFLIQALYHCVLEIRQLILHSLNKLIDIFFRVGNLLVLLSPEILYLARDHVQIAFVRSLSQLLTKYIELCPLTLTFKHLQGVLQLDQISLLLQRFLNTLQLFSICFSLQQLINILPVGLAVKCVRNRLLVCLLSQRLIHVVKICLLIYHRRQVREILLQSTGAQSLVEVFGHLIDSLIQLSQFHVDLVNITLLDQYSR